MDFRICRRLLNGLEGFWWIWACGPCREVQLPLTFMGVQGLRRDFESFKLILFLSKMFFAKFS